MSEAPPWIGLDPARLSAVEMLEAVIRCAPSSIDVVDRDGRVVLWNPAAEQLFGWAADEVIGRVHPTVAPESQSRFREILDRIFAGELLTGITLWARRKDGTSLRVSLAAAPLRDPSGAVIAAMAVINDVTDSSKAEDEIRSLARFPAENPNPIVRVGRDGVLLYANAAAVPLLAHWRTSVGGRVPIQLAEVVRQALESRQSREIDLAVGSRDLSFLVFGSAATSDANVYSRDVTDTRRAEAALRQAQKLESLGILAGGVAHDFNNLLAVILGQISLAISKLPPESPALGNLGKAAEAVERAAGLAGKMLAYSGRGQFLLKPMDLSAFVREERLLLEAAIPKNVRLVLDLATDLPPVVTDGGQMGQLLTNLVMNGAEAIGLRPGTLRITTRLAALSPADESFWRDTGQPLKPGAYVALEVADDGVGMDEATRARIFDPFFTTKFVGRGLGLPAVLGVVRGHRGGISVESEPGRGCVFTVVFPASEEDRPSGSVAPGPVRPPGRTLLVLDDEKGVLEVVSEILESEGFRVVSCSSPEEALRTFRANAEAFSLVLLDLSMPTMSGEDVLKEMASIAPGVRAILSSGYEESEMRERFGRAGFAGFLHKPYGPDALLAEVQRCLGEQP